MKRPALFSFASVLLVIGFAWAQPDPDIARVTSDTAAYCAQLAEWAEAVQMPVEAKLLHDEGVQLCARGRLQAGIVRLRRALMLTRQSQAHGGS